MKLVLAIIAALFLGACATGTLVPVKGDSGTVLGLMEGRWSGPSSSMGPSGPGQNYVSLEVKGGLGTFSMASGERWNTVPRIEGGKVLMAFGYGHREFTLLANERGEYFLEAQYSAYWKDEMRTYSVLLTKQ